MSGKIEIICGPMFSGKTEELLRRLKRLQYAKKTYYLFKPENDTRYSEKAVLTHEQVGADAIPVSKAQEIIDYINEKHEQEGVYPDVIAIDETQFFDFNESPNLIDVAKALKDHGFRIIMNGLDMNFMGIPFPIMPELLAIADDIQKLKAVCSICGEEASMSYRISNSSEQILLGSDDIYQARCHKDWKAGFNKKNEEN